MKRTFLASILLLIAGSASAAAQIGLPVLPQTGLPDTVQRLPGEITGSLEDLVANGQIDRIGQGELRRLLREARDRRIGDFLRANRRSVERDGDGNPAVRGVLLVSGIDQAALANALRRGFVVAGRERIEALDIDYVRLAVPEGDTLREARRRLEKIAGDATISEDHIYFPTGSVADSRPGEYRAAMSGDALVAGTAGGAGASIGIIDGGVASHPSLTGATIVARGFARGGLAGHPHATAIASLIAGAGEVRGVDRGARLFVADVYGGDPAGGNASNIAAAIGWLVEQRVPVAAISLVGPPNALLERAVGAARRKGLLIVAAVGNDGPAAPFNYPASYPEVVAVTGVGTDDRVLPEAGRAKHTDFAAPGAGLLAADMRGGTRRVRGTSFAVPLVAAMLVRHYRVLDATDAAGAIRALAAEARDLGKKGPDPRFGRGLVCGECGAR